MNPADAPKKPLKRLDLAKGSISWMASNPVAANLLMVSLLVGGLLFSFRIKKEVFPMVELDMIEVVVVYPGASPAEVEQGILLAIEESVRSLDGVKEVRADAAEGMASLRIELEVGTDRNKALTDVKNAIDRITTFPLEAERPIVNLPDWRTEAISLAVYGDVDKKVLHAVGEQVRDELLALPAVNYVDMFGLPSLEIGIEVGQDTLRTYGLTIGQIADKVRRTALELPAGGVETDSGEVLLRTTERRDVGRDFNDIAIVNQADGSPVRLSDVATIKDGFAETHFEATFDGKPALLIQVYSVGEQSPTEVADAVKNYLDRLNKGLPPGLKATTWDDRSRLYEERLDLLLRNASMGLVLVLLFLGLFLEPKLAFWVTMGIPTSFLGSLIFLPAMGVTINMISLFAFIVTLGMVVDDAIVVGENTFRLRQEGLPPLKAAIQGAREVAIPVFFSVSTTVAAFSPLLLAPGNRGKFMFAIPVVVISVLIISLVESFFVLPSHLGHISRAKDNGFLGLFSRLPSVSRLQQRFAVRVEHFIDRFYGPVVLKTVRKRWITLAVAIAVLLISHGLVVGERVKSIDFPREESDRVVGEAKLPFGVAIEESRSLMSKLTQAAKVVMAENGGERISNGVMSVLGFGFLTHENGEHVVSVVVTLVPSDQRPIGASRFADLWREKLGDIPGLEALTFDSSTGHRGKPIDVRLQHRDVKVLEAAAIDLADRLSGFTGVKDIEDGVELGKPQLDFTLSDDGIAAGLTSADLATQVRHAFYGAEVLRQQRGRNEIRVMVRLPRHERETLHSVEELIVQTPSGGEMLLRQAAKVVHGRAYTAIRRTDGQRTARVMADVDEGKANAQQIMNTMFGELLPELRAKYPGLTFRRAGRQRDFQDFWDFLIVGFSMALIAMYAMIAVPLRSYLQPLLVVMAAIPFGYAGAVLGHLIMGFDLSMMSWMGIVALSGVVVNDSLVLVTRANEFRAMGHPPEQAAFLASKQRFRPILLTSVTTFGGLAPMIFETSVQARMLIPMAISLGFGVMFSTLITLLLVPSLFTMVEHLRANTGTAWHYLFPADHDRAGDPT